MKLLHWLGFPDECQGFILLLASFMILTMTTGVSFDLSVIIVLASLATYQWLRDPVIDFLAGLKWPKFALPIAGDTIKFFVPAALALVVSYWLCSHLFRMGDSIATQTMKALAVVASGGLAYYGPFKLLDWIWP